MASDATRFVEVVLAWTRSSPGSAAVLKRGADDSGWTEIGRTDASEFTATGLHPERSYTFAVVPVETDGSLAAEDEWETLRVAPTADEGTPALPAAPTGCAAAQDGPNVNVRWDAATDGVMVARGARVGAGRTDGVRIAADVTGMGRHDRGRRGGLPGRPGDVCADGALAGARGIAPATRFSVGLDTKSCDA